jgi:hypothetical protein
MAGGGPALPESLVLDFANELFRTAAGGKIRVLGFARRLKDIRAVVQEIACISAENQHHSKSSHSVGKVNPQLVTEGLQVRIQPGEPTLLHSSVYGVAFSRFASRKP